MYVFFLEKFMREGQKGPESSGGGVIHVHCEQDGYSTPIHMKSTVRR
jgi:hypothetical protein